MLRGWIGEENMLAAVVVAAVAAAAVLGARVLSRQTEPRLNPPVEAEVAKDDKSMAVPSLPAVLLLRLLIWLWLVWYSSLLSFEGEAELERGM